MKNHLIIWIDPGKSIVEIPFWGDLIKRKGFNANKFYPEIASLFDKYKIPVLYSKEYKPKLESWSSDEAKSGLNRVFRIILKEEKEFPPELVNEISLIPFVKNVRPGEIGVADIPPPFQRQWHCRDLILLL